MEFLRLSDSAASKLLSEGFSIAERFEKKDNSLAKIEQDGKPLFDTKEEAERVAKDLGCSGSHEHIIDGVTWYMPCSEHSDLTDELLEGFNRDDKEMVDGIVELLL